MKAYKTVQIATFVTDNNGIGENAILNAIKDKAIHVASCTNYVKEKNIEVRECMDQEIDQFILDMNMELNDFGVQFNEVGEKNHYSRSFQLILRPKYGSAEVHSLDFRYECQQYDECSTYISEYTGDYNMDFGRKTQGYTQKKVYSMDDIFSRIENELLEEYTRNQLKK